MHFRDPTILNQKSLLQRANLDKAIDFMDSLEEDIPKGMCKISKIHSNYKKESVVFHKLAL